MIVKTFLENNDLSEKIVILFQLTQERGWSSSLNDLDELCQNSTITDGFSIIGSNAKDSQKKLNEWFEEIEN
jgi:hypothetical protein